jgi:hypothetical protein
VKSIKILGIATAMALALTAFAGAGVASANNFKTTIAPVGWTGSLTGKNHVLTVGEAFTCSGVGFSGENKIKSSSELTVAPELSGCIHNGQGPASFAMHGCKFRFHPGAGPSLVGTVDIVGCETPMSNTAVPCITEIGNQSGLGTVTYKNVATSPSTVTAIAKLSSITYTRSSGCTGGNGTFNDGTYVGEWTLKGFSNPGGVPTAVEVESTSAAPFIRFGAEEAPVTISGTGSGNKAINGGGNGVNCSVYSLSGTSASTTTEALTLTPSFKGCTVGGEAVPDGFVTAGGCSYVFHVGGSLDIAGATCASNPISATRAGCVLTIGPQSGLSGFTGIKYTNEGSGKLRKISLTGSGYIEGVAFTTVGPKCGTAGTYNGIGSLRVTTPALTATNSKGAAQGISIE